MTERPPITNLATFEGLDDTDRELTISKLIVDVHDWLTAAGNDPTVPVWEFSSTRAYAADIASTVGRLNLSDDLRLDALLVLRLAERAVGKAVRHAQALGELGSLASNSNRGAKLPSPTPYTGTGNTAHAIYRMTDGITDAQFAAALKEARADGSLTRANVVRLLTQRHPGRKKVDNRRDLVDSTRELAEQLRRVTVKLRRLHDDDRLDRNKAEVAARMRYNLADAEAVCAALRKTLDEE